MLRGNKATVTDAKVSEKSWAIPYNSTAPLNCAVLP